MAEAGARLTRAPKPILKGALRLPTAALQNVSSGMGRIVGALPFTNGFIKSYGKGSVILERVNKETVRRHFISPLLNKASYGNDVRQGMTQLVGDLKSLQAKGYKYVESISFHQGALGTALKHGFKEVDDVVLTARQMKQMRANFALIERSNLLPKGAQIFVGESGLYKPVITRLDIAAELAKLAK